MAQQKLSNVNIDLKLQDSRGRIAVWDTKARKWRWMFPIDARELIGSGFGELEPKGSGIPPRPPPKGKPGDRIPMLHREEDGTDEQELKEEPAVAQGGSRVPKQAAGGQSGSGRVEPT